MVQTLKEKRNKEKLCANYAGFAKCNGITLESNPSIPIKFYTDQCREYVIINLMWDVFSIIEPFNKEKKRYLLIHQSIFTLDYVKLQVKSPKKVCKAYQYVVQNLTWSGVYLWSTVSNNILQKVPA